MKKKIYEIYECVCPVCGNKGIILSKTTQWSPEFYCKKCRVWYMYARKYHAFGESTYKIDKFEESDFCEKHNKAYSNKDYTVINKVCSGCEDEVKIEELKKLNFTEEQINFLVKYNRYDLIELLKQLEEKVK